MLYNNPANSKKKTKETKQVVDKSKAKTLFDSIE